MKKALVMLCVGISGLAAAQVPPGTGSGPSFYTIPGIVNAAGRNNTRFVSDIALTNPGSSSAEILLTFVPEGSLADQEISLSAGRTVVWRNVVQQLWGGADASGAVLVTSDQPLIVRARTYNTASTGTFGVALPAVPEDGLLVAGDHAHCLWISQSPDGSKEFRTNVSVAFPDTGGGTADVTFFDQNGTAVGSWEFSADSAGFQQVSVGGAAGPLPAGRAEIEVKAGRAVAYASVVDNVTGDSSLFRFEPLPAGVQDVVVSGVARANGKNGTFFRTDGRFYNPTSADATMTVAFHANQNSNPSPATFSLTVPAGQILDVTDVLGSLGVPIGSSGALRFTSDSPVGILCRTSNVDPTGARPGTYGSQQKPVPLLSFLLSADAGAAITGVRQSPDPNTGYRTNIALAAGGDGATAQLTLKTAKGPTVGTATQTLGPYGWSQTAVDKLFSGTAIPDDAEILVKITQGSADVFDSSVDNASGDSVVTPAQALPAEIPSSATIGPEGGSVRSDDGKMTLRIPAGALASPSSVSITAGAGPYPDGVGPGYSLTVNGPAFATPPVVTFRYLPDDLAGTAAEWLGLGFQSGGTVYGLTGTSCDPEARTISARLSDIPTASTSAGRVPLGTLRQDIVVIYYIRIEPGETAVLSGKSVVLHVSATKETRGESPHPIVTQVDLSKETGTNWEITTDPAGSDVGAFNFGSGNDVIYSAPARVPPCGQVVNIVFSMQRGGKTVTARARVRVVPRTWKLLASVDTVIDFCGLGGGPRFQLVTDVFDLELTLQDDMTFLGAGPGMPGDQGRTTLFGGYHSGPSFCVPGCTCHWVREPTPALQFKLVIGGLKKGRIYFDYWGFLLNKDGTQDFRWTCNCDSGGTIRGSGLLPNISGQENITPRMFFDPSKSFKDGCYTKKVFSWQDFYLLMMHVPVPKDEPYKGTRYTIGLFPQG